MQLETLTQLRVSLTSLMSLIKREFTIISNAAVTFDFQNLSTSHCITITCNMSISVYHYRDDEHTHTHNFWGVSLSFEQIRPWSLTALLN